MFPIVIKYILVIFCVVIPSSVKSQEFDSLKIKNSYRFGYLYSIYGTRYRTVSRSLAGGKFKSDFKDLFNQSSDEYHLMLSAEKFNYFNARYITYLVGFPIGLALGNSIAKNPAWDNKYDIYLAFTGVAFFGIGKYLDNKGFEKLKKAVRLRNEKFNE